MAEGIVPYVAVKLSTRTGWWFIRRLGRWVARRRWPSSRVLSAVALRQATPVASPHENRPGVRVNLGAAEARIGLDVWNGTPYDLEVLGLDVELVVNGVTCMHFEVGHQGLVKSGSMSTVRLRHGLSHQELADTQRAQGGKDMLDGVLIVERHLRSVGDFHRDNDDTRLAVQVTCRFG